MIVEKIVLASFKGFKDFSAECSEFTTLVGLNNSGKTSILQAVQLLYDIFAHAFAFKERPNFGPPQWAANPSQQINRISFGDPDAIWLDKKTAEACKISMMLSGNVEVRVEIMGRSHYDLDILKNESSIKQTLGEPETRQIIEDVFALRPIYVPPVGAISPTEQLVAFPELRNRLNQGRISECWRGNLYWLKNDSEDEDFQDFVNTVKQYLPEAEIMAPGLSHDNPPKIEIRFKEKGTIFDISTSGGGLRTILNLASIIQFSNSKCLLFDEPDAHLHSSLQRCIAQMLIDYTTEKRGQVITATHAPDFIAEIGVEHLVWIDRSDKQGRRCSNIGKVLVDLGAVANVDAIRAYGADKILFLEGSLDRDILKTLVGLSGLQNPFDDDSVIVAKLPAGKGDSKHVKAFRDLLREIFRIDVKIVCITDNDYDIQDETAEETGSDSRALLLSLERKEIENYLLEANVIEAALAKAAEERKRYKCSGVNTPSHAEISGKLKEILGDQEIRYLVECQWVPRYQNTLSAEQDDSSKYKEARAKFESNWSDAEWRRRNCPGKQVLAALRKWCQDGYSLSLTDRNLVAGLKECPSDIMEIAEKVKLHLYNVQ